MSEVFAKLLDLLPAVWTRRWMGLVVAWSIAILGAIVLIFWSDRYEASATVFVDTQTVLKPLMLGLAVQPDINEQVAMIARTLVSRPNIERVLKAPSMQGGAAFSGMHDAVVERLLKDVKVDIDGHEGLYSIKYRDTDPERARKLVQSLVQLFVDSGVGDKQRDSAEAQKFIDQQIAQYDDKLREAEKRLKDFKVRNLGYTGAASADYYTRVSQLSEELVNLRGQLHAAEQVRDTLRRELSGEQPTLLPELAGPMQASDIDLRIEAQRKQLDDLLRRYTNEHPDVIATRHLIAQLEAEKKAGGDGGKDSTRYSMATNPVFQKLRMSYTDAEANVASLQARVSDEQARLNELRAEAGKVPQVEEEFAQLNRDYDVIRKNYDQLVTRRESASMSQNVSNSNQLADFRVVEPPHVEPRPVFPNRTVLIPAVLLLSLAAGIFTAFEMAQLMPTFQSARGLREVIARPILGSVSRIVSDEQVRRERASATMFVIALGALIGAYLIWTAYTLTHSFV